MDRRRALLVAALGFALLERWQSVRELVTLHAWLDSWSGLGAIVVGMQRHGYDLSLTHDRNGWRATFLHRNHVLHPWVGLGRCSTGGRRRGGPSKKPRGGRCTPRSRRITRSPRSRPGSLDVARSPHVPSCSTL